MREEVMTSDGMISQERLMEIELHVARLYGCEDFVSVAEMYPKLSADLDEMVKEVRRCQWVIEKQSGTIANLRSDLEDRYGD
jgi:hypothetical protein